MDAAALRALQAPLEQRDRGDPAAARVPITAVAAFSDPGITCTVQTWAGPVRAGLHPLAGGDGDDACPGDMLLQALLACAGVTMRSVATAMGVPVRAARLSARAEMDARGPLGVARDGQAGLGRIEVLAELDTDADAATLARLGELTERSCVVVTSLAVPPRLTVVRAADLAPPAIDVLPEPAPAVLR